ncbi:MAG: hypothetical protein ACOCXH_14280, partial [Cyclobacteriaceae bacterium]
MDEKNYNSDQEKDWNSDYNQKKEEESDDFGLPDVSYDPYKKDREQSYDYGQSESNTDQPSEQYNSGDYNQSSDYGSYNSGYGSSSESDKKEEDQYNDNYDDNYQDDYQRDTYDDEYNDDPYYDDDEEGADNTGKVLIIILAILIVAAGLFAGYWFWLKDILYPPEDDLAETEIVDENAGDDGMTEPETNAVPQDALEEEDQTTADQDTETDDET